MYSVDEKNKTKIARGFDEHMKFQKQHGPWVNKTRNLKFGPKPRISIKHVRQNKKNRKYKKKCVGFDLEYGSGNLEKPKQKPIIVFLSNFVP